MPKGKHKGGKRFFTNFEEVQQQKLKEEKEKAWRKARGEEDDDDEDKKENSDDSKESGSSEEESSSEEEEAKPSSSVAALIQIENPNRAPAKNVKVSSLTGDSAKPELSRREREEINKARANAHYRKLHAQGKTEEARADLERLSLIRKQREEAVQRKEEEKKAKEAAQQAKRDEVAKVLNKKDRR